MPSCGSGRRGDPGWQIRHRRGDNFAPTDQEGYILTAVTRLLALLIGFTFSLAIDRFDERRGAVLQEAQAIRSAYLKSQVLGEPYRMQMSRLLVGYADNKIALGAATPGAEQRMLLAKNEQFLTKLWRKHSLRFRRSSPSISRAATSIRWTIFWRSTRRARKDVARTS